MTPEDLIYTGKIPWDVEGYILTDGQLYSRSRGNYSYPHIQAILKSILFERYPDQAVAASHQFRYGAIQRFWSPRQAFLAKRGLVEFNGSNQPQLNCALIEALCKIPYSVDIRMVSNPDPSLSIFPDEEVVALAIHLKNQADRDFKHQDN